MGTKGYKAFDKNLKCLDMQYEIGKTYEHKGEIELCKSGFHFCRNPFDVLNYHDLIDSRFAEVESIGEEKSDIDKTVASKLEIKKELSIKDFIEAQINIVFEFCFTKTDKKQKNIKSSSGYSAQLASSGNSAKLASSGYYAKLASSGDYAQLASSGDYAQLASSGDYAKLASSGDYAKLASSGNSAKLASSGNSAQLASSGDSAQLASSGYYAKLASSGKNSVIAGIGYKNIAKGINGNWIVLAEYNDKNEPICVKCGEIGKDGLKENVYYKLMKGEFVEV